MTIIIQNISLWKKRGREHFIGAERTFLDGKMLLYKIYLKIKTTAVRAKIFSLMLSKPNSLINNTSIFNTSSFANMQDQIKVKVLPFFKCVTKYVFSRIQQNSKKNQHCNNWSFDFIQPYNLKIWLNKILHDQISLKLEWWSV